MNYGEGGYSLSDIAAATGRNNDGFGDGNGWWIIIFLIFAFGGWGNRGFGGYGGTDGGVMNNYVLTSDFSQLSRQISDTYNMTERKLDGINNGLCSGFYQEAQLVNGVNTNILTTGNAIQSQIADVGYGIKDCCCQQLRAIDGINFNMAQNTCAITNNATLNTRDIIDNMNANYKALHDEIVANRIEDKNAQIAAQQNEIAALRLAASQERQNNYLVEKLQYPKCPIPAYQVPNPYCNCNSGCGC